MVDTYARFEALCRKNKLNITAMCKKCGIPRASLSDYKMGRIKTLSAATLSKISEYFGVSVEFLMGLPEVPANEENVKTALFGTDITVTEEMWAELKLCAMQIKQREIEKTSPVF